MSDMKILTLDIETTPNDVYAWGLWQQNIMLPFLKEPTRMLSWAAKWVGDDHVYFASEASQGRKIMVKEIYKMVNEADAIITFNGKSFDMKHLNREFMEQGLLPPTPYHNIDLLQTVRQNFKLPSNKLDYVAQWLGLETKLQHTGLQLWIDVMQGDDKAWEMMEDYNVQDVIVTENVYFKLRGWIKNHPNHGLYIEDQESPVCRNCGGTHIHSKGNEYDTTGVFAYARYKCQDCGANLRGRKNIKGSAKKSPQVLK